jgi:hypothetical protein
MAQPGTVNYLEGEATLDGQPITMANVGSALLGPNQRLQTANGKAELLLTPGVFLRLAPSSSVKMISPSITNTRVELTGGEAMLEVAQYFPGNHIQIDVGSAATTVDKYGVYEFTAMPTMARVFDGKLTVNVNGRMKTLGKGDEAALDPNNPKLKVKDFDIHATEKADELYTWSKLRAEYTAEANMSAAATYEGYGSGYGPGWYGAGWYWNPYYSQYAFLLGDGFLWDPFGYAFFSPGYWGIYAPYFGYGRGFAYGYGHGFVGGPGTAITRSSAAGTALASGFNGAGMGVHSAGAVGGGFHGGGGGRR